jgi:hypothetical protein
MTTDDIYPGVDVYERIARPMTVVLPADGFYAARRPEVQRIVAARPDRRLVGIDGHHNPVMSRPDEIAEIVAAVG